MIVLFETINAYKNLLINTLRISHFQINAIDTKDILVSFLNRKEVKCIISSETLILNDIYLPIILSNYSLFEVQKCTDFPSLLKTFNLVESSQENKLLFIPIEYLNLENDTIIKNAPLENKSSDIQNLTTTEIIVLNKLAEGMSYKMIADTLNISIQTAKTHIKNIYKKLGVNNAAGAVGLAKQIKLL